MLPTQQRMLFSEYILASLRPKGSEIRTNWTDEVQRRMDAVDIVQSSILPE